MPLSACFGKSGGRRGAGIRQNPIGVAALHARDHYDIDAAIGCS
jgi:hypothetical protein